MSIKHFQFLARHTFPAQGAQEGIDIQGGIAQHLRKTPGTGVPLKIHLPEAVLGMDVAFSEKEIVFRTGVNVGNAGLIAINVHRAVQLSESYFSIGLRKRIIDGSININACSKDDKDNESKQT